MPQSPFQTPLKWDIFCTVIDNFGDIGVSWRLAKTLSHDFAQIVRLFVDDLNALKALVPQTNPLAKQQVIEQIEVILWDDALTTRPGDVVIETFGCHLPPGLIQQMQKQKPIWINLEYFSAEPWVQDFHLMPSKQANGLDKTFFFPSILEHSGGLMREADLLSRRQTFMQTDHQAWLSSIGLPKPLENSFKISLFAYENNALATLFESWQQSSTPIEIYLPQGRLLTSAEQALKQTLSAGQSLKIGQMTLHILPFLPQAEYDALLWLCDLNFVRGEESLVRAQWAGKPFIWHIYPTDDQAHWDKLNAFFNVYSKQLSAPAKDALIEFNQAWNHQSVNHQAWLNLIQNQTVLNQHAEAWIQYLENLGELTSNLVKFVKSKV